MQKILFICLVFLLGTFLWQLKSGKGGFIDDNKVKQQIIVQEKKDQALINRNELMMVKISGLKGSNDSLEARSRSELNLIKRGETLVLLPGSDVNIKQVK